MKNQTNLTFLYGDSYTTTPLNWTIFFYILFILLSWISSHSLFYFHMDIFVSESGAVHKVRNTSFFTYFLLVLRRVIF